MPVLNPLSLHIEGDHTGNGNDEGSLGLTKYYPQWNAQAQRLSGHHRQDEAKEV